MITESCNAGSRDIDTKSIPEILSIMNRNDMQVASAVEKVLPQIAEAVEIITGVLQSGGRLFYIGAGTSGRLGVADAAECPPTFGVPADMVQAVIAGGRQTVFKAREGCEDKALMGRLDLARRGFSSSDVLVGIGASGRTPYVVGALRYAREMGARTVCIMCNPEGAMAEYSDVVIAPVVGPEVITGSTRLKAGTATKMVLNMLSTAAMIKLGRVKGNMMSNMQVSCSKLRERAVSVLASSGMERGAALSLLEETGYDVDAALRRANETRR